MFTTNLTDKEKQIAAKIGFDEAALLRVKQETGPGALAFLSRPLDDDEQEGFDQEYEEYDEEKAGDEDEEDANEKWYALIATAPREVSEATLLRLRAPLLETGYLPFLIDQAFDFQDRPDKIAVLKTTDPLAPLRFCQTNAANYDLGPEEVQAKFAEWAGRFDYDLLGAGPDWVDMRFHTLPDDLDAFACELYEFCPDLLDQGISVMIDEGFDYLSPEQQEAIQNRLDADTGDDEDGKTERVALKMLAETVQTERRMRFWWD